MAMIRTVWAVIVGAIAAAIVGALFEFFKPDILQEGVEYKYLYMWVAGLGGLLASIVALFVNGRGQPRQAAEPVSKAAPKGKLVPKQVKGAEKRGGITVKESKDVPGMPTFDIDTEQARKKHDAGNQHGGKPK